MSIHLSGVVSQLVDLACEQQSLLLTVNLAEVMHLFGLRVGLDFVSVHVSFSAMHKNILLPLLHWCLLLLLEGKRKQTHY